VPRMDRQTQDDFLAQPHIGVIASLREDGRPYTVPVWYHWDGEAMWLTGTDSRVWCRQIRRDPRVSLCIEAMAPVAGHIGVDGTAEVIDRDDADIWPMCRLLAQKYLDRGEPTDQAVVDAFLANMRTEPRLLVKVTPEVWRAIDMRVYRGKRADRQFRAEA
jgi:PPOX class probable F420-dependent enzyme